MVTHELKSKNKAIINRDSSQDAKVFYSNSEKWKNYSRRIGKNKFFRKYLYQSYSGICQFCGKELDPDTFVLHHKTYMHECITSATVSRPHPSEKRPNRTSIAPDCLSCFIDVPEAFDECFSRIVPVCCICNMIIDKIYTKQHQKNQKK